VGAFQRRQRAVDETARIRADLKLATGELEEAYAECARLIREASEEALAEAMKIGFRRDASRERCAVRASVQEVA
jgi:hypothetical protein